MYGKKNWRTVFSMAVLVACFASSVQSGARWFNQYSQDNSDSSAAEKAADAAKKAATGAMEKAGDVVNKAAEAVNKATDGGAEKAVDAVEKAAAGAMEKAGDVVNKAAEAVNKATDGGAEKAVDAVEKAAAGAMEKAGDVVNKAADAVNKATDGGAEKAVDAVEKAAAGAMEKAGDVVNKAAEAVNKATDGGAEKAVDAVEKAAAGAMEKAGDVVNKAADAVGLPVQGTMQSRESLLENQKTLFKDYDLDKLLHHIRTVLEHHNLKNVQEQFHQLFDKQDSSVYSCTFESVFAEENLKEMHKDAKQTEDYLQKAHKFLEKTISDRIEPEQGKETSSFSSQELYKKGYDALLAANYVDAEKAFCTFQQRYQKDPLRDDALFWLAEALLGQKRYHEAAQVYLNVWYADKKKAYTSEILLKLARSMVALEPNKEACALSTQKAKHSETLESIFCKPLKRSEVIHGVH
ncbi:hypothetical protein [Bartonella sp. ML70XJBT.G]|uniref:hypothetical protein n=1 Tax=Bartonella sp. ML70XJBT.G TaxID=3019093 RepID=UPI0023630001|nr:hypothetical protein [Bartonella sp. ML70XJBT.G]